MGFFSTFAVPHPGISMAEHTIKHLTPQSEVWQRLLAGDRQALNVLFSGFYDDLYFYGLKLCHQEPLVNDAIQDVFLKLWTSRDTLHTIQKPGAYLFRMFRHRLLLLCRQSVVRKRHNEHYSDARTLFVFSAEDLIITHEISTEQQRHLLDLLNGLTERQREIIYLKFYGNHSNPEIAEIMNMKLQSVANLLARTIQALRKAASADNALFTLANLFIISRL